MERLILVLLVVLGVVLLFGALWGSHRPMTTPTSISGEMLYHLSCVGCHGSQGWGTEFGSPIVGMPIDQVKAFVRGAGPPMPRFGPELISDAGLQAIVEYVRTFTPPALTPDLRAALEESVRAAEAQDKEATMLQLRKAIEKAPPELRGILGVLLGFLQQPPEGIPPGMEFEIVKTDTDRLLGRLSDRK